MKMKCFADSNFLSVFVLLIGLDDHYFVHGKSIRGKQSRPNYSIHHRGSGLNHESLRNLQDKNFDVEATQDKGAIPDKMQLQSEDASVVSNLPSNTTDNFFSDSVGKGNNLAHILEKQAGNSEGIGSVSSTPNFNITNVADPKGTAAQHNMEKAGGVTQNAEQERTEPNFAVDVGDPKGTAAQHNMEKAGGGTQDAEDSDNLPSFDVDVGDPKGTAAQHIMEKNNSPDNDADQLFQDSSPNTAPDPKGTLNTHNVEKNNNADEMNDPMVGNDESLPCGEENTGFDVSPGPNDKGGDAGYFQNKNKQSNRSGSRTSCARNNDAHMKHKFGP